MCIIMFPWFFLAQKLHLELTVYHFETLEHLVKVLAQIELLLMTTLAFTLNSIIYRFS